MKKDFNKSEAAAEITQGAENYKGIAASMIKQAETPKATRKVTRKQEREVIKKPTFKTRKDARVSLYVPAELKERLEAAARQEDCSVNSYIQAVMTSYLDSKGI